MGILVEAALTHNLESELSDILSMCNGKIRDIVGIYTSRFEYQNAKVVFRSVVNDVELARSQIHIARFERYQHALAKNHREF